MHRGRNTLNNSYIGYFLAFFYTFVAVFYTLLIKKRQTLNNNKSLVHIGRTYSLHWWNHVIFRVFRTLIWGICVLRVLWPAVDNYLIPINLSHNLVINLFGICLMLIGFCLTMLSNFTLARDWRSGIDANNSTSLVTTGIFKFSRNPGYLGVAISQLGFFFALPTIFTLVCLGIGWLALHVQIRLEESHLFNTHKNQYVHYSEQVRRWI